MAKKAKDPGALLTHPGFDPRSRSYGKGALGVSPSLQRGYLVWADKGGNVGYTGGPFGDGRDMIRFQYNPSTISSSYAVANASLQAAMMYPVPGSTGQLLAPLQQQAQFELYYDRTYELAYGSGANTGKGRVNDPAVIGCQSDVIQFMQFTGMLADVADETGGIAALSTTGGDTSSGLSAGAQTNALGTGGIMTMMPCWFFPTSSAVIQAFNNNSTNYNSLSNALSYYGYLDSWSVQYTHWTAAMVPIRCVISVSLTMLPTPANPGTLFTDLTNAGLYIGGGGGGPSQLTTPTGGVGGPASDPGRLGPATASRNGIGGR